MKSKQSVFIDPLGKFRISILPEWEYNQNNESEKKGGPYQFGISESCVFQISCKPINDHISKIITDNKFNTYDFSQPTVSFYEKFIENVDITSYVWMCPIEDYFIFAMYYYDPAVKNPKDIGLDLLSIRSSLRNINFSRTSKNKIEQISSETVLKDYYKIETWNEKPSRFFDFMTASDKSKGKRIAPLEIDAIKLYTLLKLKISDQPNGFYTTVRLGLPLDNMFWWDFILECDKGFIQIWRTPHIIEALYVFEEEDFDLIKFLNDNIKENINEILKEIGNFEKHTVYINHYKSYKDCVSYLWDEVSNIDLTPPSSINQHLIEDQNILDKYHKELKSYMTNSVKFHTLGKSMVLNAAFKIESFINLTIRVGASQEVRNYPDVLDKYLRYDFGPKIKNMRFYSSILIDDIDMDNQAIKDGLELMTLRNKYVHYDEKSPYNKLGEILFDRDFPLHPVLNDRPAVDSIKQIFHKPDFNTVSKAYHTSNNFVNYIESLFNPKYKSKLITTLEQNPISYNETEKNYSVIFNRSSLDFFTS